MSNMGYEEEQPSPKARLNSRHERECKICRHPRREEIEIAFVEWQPTTRIARDYGLGSRQSLCRHARACGLIAQNVASALAAIIERGARARVSAAVAVQAIVALSKINSRGQWIDRSETVNLNELFNRMSRDEMLHYAETGLLPSWFEETIGGRPIIQAAGDNEAAE
jgi:hypothetical protein